MTKVQVSYANVTDLHTVPVARCRTFRGRLAPREMELLEDAFALVLGLPALSELDDADTVSSVPNRAHESRRLLADSCCVVWGA